jgi:hypothetical protein
MTSRVAWDRNRSSAPPRSKICTAFPVAPHILPIVEDTHKDAHDFGGLRPNASLDSLGRYSVSRLLV